MKKIKVAKILASINGILLLVYIVECLVGQIQHFWWNWTNILIGVLPLLGSIGFILGIVLIIDKYKKSKKSDLEKASSLLYVTLIITSIFVVATTLFFHWAFDSAVF